MLMNNRLFEQFTLDVYETFITDLTRLQAWFAWHLLNHAGIGFDEVIENRVFFHALAHKVSDQEGDEWKNRCHKRYCDQGVDPHTAALEEWVLTQNLPFIRKHGEEEYLKGWVKPLSTPFFGFSYEYHPEYDAEGATDLLTLHFRNHFIPDSPLNHRDKLLEGLRMIVSQVAMERPDVKTAQCATWLNSVKSFASLFPPEWASEAIPGNPGNHMGWWGQFMDRTGGLHARNAERLRSTGEFPFQHRKCTCSIARLREHLFHADKTG